MNPELLAAIGYYLAQNCSADIHLHCGPDARAIGSPIHHTPEHGCPVPCPEIDYSNPNQPYFWDHTEMN